GNLIGMASNILRDVKEPLRFTSFVGEEEADVVAAFEAEQARGGYDSAVVCNYCQGNHFCWYEDECLPCSIDCDGR
ncbi:hypothetical protein COV16_01475, partial [Candidatus Woesearchaeota archaeon CG10_big_fil_rev_8_21_14_0_10_34_8]